MKTEILIACLFLMVGLFIGAGLAVWVIWKYFTPKYEDFKEEEIDEEAIKQVPVNIFEEIKNKVKDGIVHEATKIESFKEVLSKELHRCTNSDNEDYEKGAFLRDTLKTLDEWYEPRKKWFLDRVGKRVKSEKLFCDCEHCTESFEKGLLIESENMAMELFAQENAGRLKMDKNYYFDYE